MPRTKQQVEAIRQQRVMQIFDAALDVFAHKGFHSATIADIAQKAGIAKGLLYHYYSSKEELLSHIVINGMNNLIEKFDENHDGVLTDAEMELFINDMFRKIVENRNYWKLYFSVMLQPNVFSKELMQKLEGIYEPMVSILIQYFRRKGYQNPEMEFMILHALSDGIVINYISNENFPLDAIKEEIIKRYIK
ncbi:MAG: TetR/AcrR family transcriptional regulator [Tenuifilum sp.]|uniref:TetR/AcrR family transcriptional regulator n=2 Tax=Tenuifilum sp. TaxID=2760880 RepID=UPI001B3E16EC|nr:TetR/AcrR family transcriptional regulator [Bacteroidales bacterium]MBP9030162.1 TetR/AcrR family transcriptional regulator [Bacteroidales bacterium]HQG73144.1 TetR/AcrR family transcriptional regulator [Tenuifilum sp.]HQI88537.1 TetR/AcrR family transcriptional regulator [Tenuifilum sp.]